MKFKTINAFILSIFLMISLIYFVLLFTSKNFHIVKSLILYFKYKHLQVYFGSRTSSVHNSSYSIKHFCPASVHTGYNFLNGMETRLKIARVPSTEFSLNLKCYDVVHKQLAGCSTQVKNVDCETRRLSPATVVPKQGIKTTQAGPWLLKRNRKNLPNKNPVSMDFRKPVLASSMIVLEDSTQLSSVETAVLNSVDFVDNIHSSLSSSGTITQSLLKKFQQYDLLHQLPNTEPTYSVFFMNRSFRSSTRSYYTVVNTLLSEQTQITGTITPNPHYLQSSQAALQTASVSRSNDNNLLFSQCRATANDVLRTLVVVWNSFVAIFRALRMLLEQIQINISAFDPTEEDYEMEQSGVQYIDVLISQLYRHLMALRDRSNDLTRLLNRDRLTPPMPQVLELAGMSSEIHELLDYVSNRSSDFDVFVVNIIVRDAMSITSLFYREATNAVLIYC